MNWYAAERERQFREAQAVAAGERRRLMKDLKAMQEQQRRVQRMKLLAFLNAKWLAFRRAKSGASEQVTAETGRVAMGNGRGG